MSIDVVSMKDAVKLYVYGGIETPDRNGEIVNASEFVDIVRSATSPIVVRLATVGGDPIAAAFMFQALVDYDGPVSVIVDSKAYSAGSLILQGADEGRRFARPMAMIMTHAPRIRAPDGENATEENLREYADILAQHKQVMANVYARHGIEQKRIHSWMKGDRSYYFNAETALNAGLIDKIENENLAGASERYMIAAQQEFNVNDYYRSSDMPENPVDKTANTDKATSTPVATSISADTPKTTAEIVAHQQRADAQALADGRKAEHERMRGLLQLKQIAAFEPPAVQAVLDQCMEDVSVDVNSARERAHEALALLPESRPVRASSPSYEMPNMPIGMGGRVSSQGSLRISGGTSRIAEGMQLALEIRSGVELDRDKIDAERRGNEFLSMRLVEIMGMELRAAGHSSAGNTTDIATRYCNTLPVIMAQGGPGTGAGHLPTILGNIAHKSAMQGWAAAPETWGTWVVNGTLQNYQTHTRGNIALLDKLKKMLPGEPWEHGQMKDVAQRITGFFHGLVYSLAIQDIVNDDLGELTRAMNGWGEAANATVGDVVHLIMTEDQGGGNFGQIMDEDSKAIFHADHNNVAASGGAPTVDTLNTARAAMMTQVDPNQRRIASLPRYIQFGPALFSTVYTLLRSQQLTAVDVSGGDTRVESGANAVTDMNLMPIEEYRLVGANANVWHLLAARRTVEVSGVQGAVAPRVDQMPISETPGMSYSLSMPFGAAALDFRGMYRNGGA